MKNKFVLRGAERGHASLYRQYVGQKKPDLRRVHTRSERFQKVNPILNYMRMLLVIHVGYLCFFIWRHTPYSAGNYKRFYIFA